jgi:hypothetical protein
MNIRSLIGDCVTATLPWLLPVGFLKGMPVTNIAKYELFYIWFQIKAKVT